MAEWDRKNSKDVARTYSHSCMSLPFTNLFKARVSGTAHRMNVGKHLPRKDPMHIHDSLDTPRPVGSHPVISPISCEPITITCTEAASRRLFQAAGQSSTMVQIFAPEIAHNTEEYRIDVQYYEVWALGREPASAGRCLAPCVGGFSASSRRLHRGWGQWWCSAVCFYLARCCKEMKESMIVGVK
jgi:hypothetical protein